MNQLNATIDDAACAAVVAAAREALGRDRVFEANVCPDTGRVDLYLVLDVTDDAVLPGRTVSLAQARTIDDSFVVGDAVMIQIFYRSEDAATARHQESLYGALTCIGDAAYEPIALAAQAYLSNSIVSRTQEGITQ